MSPVGPDSVIGGRYRIIRVLGEGGMGAVYEALNLRTHRRVAIKTMRPEVAGRPEFARRFEREAQAAGQLRHANIVDVIDVGDDPEHELTFIVQEFLSGGDLGAAMRQATVMDPRVALATLLPVLDALSTAHRAGIVHRDVKPDNIFLHETADGVVPKLIDFGIARLDDTDAHSRTATGTVIGSPSYMSPEQALGDPAIDARTDVWSIGVVFHEALSGLLPYDAASANALIAKIIYEEPIALAVHAPQLPRDLIAVIQRAITRDRAARWPTMQAFADALRACSSWRGVDAATAARWVINADGVSRAAPPALEPIDALGRTMEAPPAPVSAPPAQRSDIWNGEVEDPAPPRRRPWPAMLVAGGFIAALAITAGLTMSTRPVRPAVSTLPAVAPPPRPVEAPPAVVPVAVPVAPRVLEAVAVSDGGALPPTRAGRREHRAEGARAATARGVVTTHTEVVPPAPAPIAAPPTAAPTRRGFNGARILE